ncbi:nSTAND1 domain-containing NTPase [Streptomyces sp. NBC_01477]|uniref:nSTAND1 domain-containing NTPase n=1 Tax=Streptomyces sp. NBC_01477 TaxID=2976015 RepID=UPI002E3445B6|nr:hypothetical protein [Streptomyces sp. NBC_01477]
MPRQERPLEDGDTPVLRFAADLRQLRLKAGAPSYRQLAVRAHASAASLSVAAGGRRLPTLAVTIAYVEGCGGDVEAWRLRWHDVADALGAAAEAGGGAAPAEGEAGGGAVPAPGSRAGLPADGTGAGPVSGYGSGIGDAVPYLGAAPFRPDDAEWFFGREALAADLRERLRHRRVVTVTGPSGAGKTSLLNAGLIALLRAEGHPGPVVVLTPGPDPLRKAGRWLARPGAGLSPGHGESVVVIDQFEELFTLCGSSAERLRFLDLLGSAAAAGRRRIVICTRADAYDRWLGRPLPSSALFDDPLVVGPMAPEDLRRAVTEPAARAGCPAQEDLVAVLVAAAAGQPGALPLVSAVLREVWLRRDGGVLSLSVLRAVGGIDGVAARCAEAAWADLPEALHRRARSVLLRLAAAEAPAGPGPAAVALSDLDDDPVTRTVLERFARARALTLDRDRAMWAHAAVARTWTRLARWAETEAQNLRVHRRLTEAARAWHAHGRPPERLYRGVDLAEAHDLCGRDGHEPTVREREFLDAAAQARRKRRRAAAADRARLRGQRRIIIALAAALVAVMTAAPLVALR